MKTAVLVIDMQRAFFEQDNLPYDAAATVSHINAVTEWAHTTGTPVVFIQHQSADVPAGSDAWRLQQDLLVRQGDQFVQKCTPDAFQNTILKPLLDQHDIDHLIICGYASEFCVDTTVRRAAELGYAVDLVADAHTTHDKPHSSGEFIRQHHNCTLPQITSFGVTVRALATAELTHPVIASQAM
ncbi:isochorismatase family protein [Shewanella sp. C32]|uniref:Isochorismatase family protein n=1 Tax=Shewanella electrica TaxID=515560 RepID=A0ABT2FGZ1_9GAMM|nr:isochorismatase family protein [Shewanella electrica]MCH1923482.1 isochorismatase family protein [Shewanella electrica]MCS4555579.1 isochorismatase family protein [Shewanella electrica]